MPGGMPRWSAGVLAGHDSETRSANLPAFAGDGECGCAVWWVAGEDASAPQRYPRSAMGTTFLPTAGPVYSLSGR